MLDVHIVVHEIKEFSKMPVSFLEFWFVLFFYLLSFVAPFIMIKFYRIGNFENRSKKKFKVLLQLAFIFVFWSVLWITFFMNELSILNGIMNLYLKLFVTVFIVALIVTFSGKLK